MKVAFSTMKKYIIPNWREGECPPTLPVDRTLHIADSRKLSLGPLELMNIPYH